MGFFDKIKDKIAPAPKEGQPLWHVPDIEIQRQMNYFKDTYRIGILALYSTDEEYEIIAKYKRELDNLGYETEVLFFVNELEAPRNIMLPNFSIKDISKNGVPENPRIDRFIKKKFDMLFNLFFSYNEHLAYIAKQSLAKCRIGAYRDQLVPLTDLFVYTNEENELTKLIDQINETLKKQAYERKHI
jgi:hypothetical protein